jgi:hypothetical protein
MNFIYLFQHISEPYLDCVISGAGTHSIVSTDHINDVPKDSVKFIYPKGLNFHKLLCTVFAISAGESNSTEEAGGAVYVSCSYPNCDFEYIDKHGNTLYNFTVVSRLYESKSDVTKLKTSTS